MRTLDLQLGYPRRDARLALGLLTPIALTSLLLGACADRRVVVEIVGPDGGADAASDTEHEDTSAADGGSNHTSTTRFGSGEAARDGGSAGNTSAGSAGADPAAGSGGDPAAMPGSAGSAGTTAGSASSAGASGAAGSGAGSAAAGSGAGSGANSGAAAPTPPSATASCTRDMLRAQVDAYFDALAAHDPAPLPVAPTLKVTENAKEIPLGQGLWKTAGKVAFKRSALDTERCATVTEAVIDNAGAPTIIGLRLQLANAQITEVETFIAALMSGALPPMPVGLLSSAGENWDATVPAGQQSSRDQLNAIADVYFDLYTDAAAAVPFGMPCDQLYNGFSLSKGSCLPITFGTLLVPSERRYPVADVETGIVVGFALISGSLNLTMLKVEAGKIRYINSVWGAMATTSGWK